jgi:hypothetical protein
MNTIKVTTRPGPDGQQHGISRSLALGRILHFEALMRRRLGEVRAQRYIRLYNYYSNQELPPDNVDQPLLVNYFKQITDKHTSYLWGQWKERLFSWRVTPIGKEEMTPAEVDEAVAYGRKIKRFLDRIYDENSGNVTFWQASKNGCLYGDSMLEVRFDEVERRIVIENVLPEYFHAMWDISNMQKLNEVIIAYPIDRVLALEQYGTSGNDQFLGYQAVNPQYLPGIGVLWKRWATTSTQIWVDDCNVINQPNPYMPRDEQGNIYPGIIPFIHIPNMQAGAEYFGYSDGENMMQLQDEINRRLADMGDSVNMHSHAIVTLKNFSGNTMDLPVGPDAIWDLGRDGEANRLEGTGPAPETMEYVHEVKTTMYETSSMPESAFGTHRGGSSHNSGIAIALTMMPVVERSREKRIRWAKGLTDLAKMIFYMLYVRDQALLESQGLDYRRVLMYKIEPVFAEILPKDELQEVNEAVALYANGLRSLERALEKLGEDDVLTEVRRIQQDMMMKAQMGGTTPPAEGGTAGKNSDTGVGGSADLPGGIGASAGKPGTLIQSPDLESVDNVNLSNSI